ncbi:lamin tail domain-containing protein [Candidatus Woesearchaeota archaeon]|nr:lamin tail domain-containing protein [Candidatus Woesearchaeota archaeon]
MLKYLIILLLICNSVSALNINEIMYNPIGSSDNYKEFVELYSPDLIDLTGYIISDGDFNDTLKKINNFSSNYMLIVEDNYMLNVPENISLYSAGASIGNGLSDDDIVLLYDKNNSLVDSAQIFSIDDGYSLEFYNGNFYQSLSINGTPGYENDYNEAEVTNYEKIKINEIFPDPYGSDNAEMPDGEFIELYNSGNYDLNLEGLKIKDEANHEIIITNTNTKTTIIESKDYLTVYMNGFSGLLNNNGFEKIKLFYGDELLDEISYFNSEEDLSWSKQESDLWNLRKPTRNKKNEENEPEADSELKINKINIGSDEKAKFGDNLLVSVDLYKGNTTRYAVYLYAEDKNGETISKRTTVHANQKYTDYEFTLPVQIEPNCNAKYSDGTFNITLEGLGEKVTKEIPISGITTSLCEKVKTEKKVEKECKVLVPQAKMENVLNPSTSSITSNIIYESSDIKTQRSALYIFSLIIIMLMMHMVFKKWR